MRDRSIEPEEEKLKGYWVVMDINFYIEAYGEDHLESKIKEIKENLVEYDFKVEDVWIEEM